MDALEALGEHRADAEQLRTLRRPVARRARAVLLAREHDERHALARVLHRRVVDRHLLAVGQVQRDAALGAGRELVAQPHVGERAAHHHLVVAAARAVRVEVARLDAVLDRATARPGCRARMLPAGEMWSVVTLSPSSASTRAPSMSADRRGRRRRCRRGTAAGGCTWSSGPTRSGRRSARRQRAPALVAVEDRAVALREHARGRAPTRRRS